ELLDHVADQLAQVTIPEHHAEGMTPDLSSRDLTMLAHAYARLHSPRTPEMLSLVSRASQLVMRDFTAKELQVLTVSLARAGAREDELLEAISTQARRRLAQFPAEALALMLRGMAFFGRTDGLFTEALAQLPRVLPTCRPADVATLLCAFAQAEVRSTFLFDLVTPFILEKAPMFTGADWLLALRAYARSKYVDPMFLSALALHLKVRTLSPDQRCACLAYLRELRQAGADAALEGMEAQLVTEGEWLPESVSPCP
ncbi:unnamed protein product, partial [Effrenium voratum]